MKHTKNFDGLVLDAIGDNERRASDDELTSSRDSAGTSSSRVIIEELHDIPDSRRDTSCCLTISLSDVGPDVSKVRDSGFRPLDVHLGDSRSSSSPHVASQASTLL